MPLPVGEVKEHTDSVAGSQVGGVWGSYSSDTARFRALESAGFCLTLLQKIENAKTASIFIR